MKTSIALGLRILLFMLAGSVAALPFADFNQATGILTIDLQGASKFIAGFIWVGIGGGTFVWSRIAKARGGVT